MKSRERSRLIFLGVLISVRAFDRDSPTAVYDCPISEGGFLCGKCQALHRIGLLLPQTCHMCSSSFSYHGQVNVTDLEMYSGNISDPMQRIVYWLGWDEGGEPVANLRDCGPTTACFDCGKIVPVGDVYYASKRDERALCEWCYRKAEKAGRARSVTR